MGKGLVPIIEAQACGTRVIGSNWAATADLVADDGFKVEGQPFWDEPQKAFYQIPILADLVRALEEAYEADRGVSSVARSFALQFDIETVWSDYWLAFLRDYLAKA